MSTLYSVYEVFTPTTQAQINFVDRNTINDDLVDALRTPGKQLIVYGESGSGKSTLLLNKLRQIYSGHITTQCSAAMTYDKLLLDGFDQLDQYYLVNRSTQKGRSVSPSLVADFSRIRASVDATLSQSATRSEARVLPPQLTAQRLAQFLGAQDMCWVVEDFHKMPDIEKLPFSQSMKIFCDVSATYPAVKTITIGAAETARQVVEYDPEMSRRVSEFLVPLMTDEELASILRNGRELLNVDMSELVEPIVQYSAGLPGVCHQLALNACLENGIMTTQSKLCALDREALKPAAERYIRESSDTLQARFDKALKRHRVRRFDNCRLILAAIASGPLSGMLVSDILNTIRETEADYPAGNLTQYLRELTQDARGNILRLGADGKYRFADPLYYSFAQLTLLEQRHPTSDVSGGYFGYIVGNTLTSITVSDSDWMKFYSTHELANQWVYAIGSEPAKPRLYVSPSRRVRKQIDQTDEDKPNR
jgi:hypothetical protein